MLTEREIASFVADGFVAVRGAFPRALADRGRAELWADTGCDPDDPATWTRPVVRLGGYHSAPFVEAANTPALHAAYDRLVGAGRWRAPLGLGTFPVRFPTTSRPATTAGTWTPRSAAPGGRAASTCARAGGRC